MRETTIQMCQNEDCSNYRVATKLMGGCECGEPLVRYQARDKPTVRQLAEFISAVSSVDPAIPNRSVEWAERELEQSPEAQERLVRHFEQLEGAANVQLATQRQAP